jgi:hypothetical protein
MDSNTRTWLRWLIQNGLAGAALGVLLATVLVISNLSALATIMRASIGVPAGWALLALLLGTGFGFSAMATAVMLTAEPPAGHSRAAKPAFKPAPAAVRVSARQSRSR